MAFWNVGELMQSSRYSLGNNVVLYPFVYRSGLFVPQHGSRHPFTGAESHRRF